MLTNKSSLDKIDRQILSLLQKNPLTTHTEIATKIDRSQPTVGLRIKKLQESGILDYQAGTSLRKAHKQLARVDIETKNPEKIEKLIEQCPYMIHGYRTTGRNNLTVVLMGKSIKELYRVIEFHFRNDPDIHNITTGFITKFVNDFVLPFDVNKINCECAHVH
ncbi:MAG: Lrp/AsnC family transcriptional regulator [Promethearchaeota archaeon]|nr:MAG: Lrp/AsnC family transcriptional regulator [Candidatus Lokiarchaeota archaeon]